MEKYNKDQVKVNERDFKSNTEEMKGDLGLGKMEEMGRKGEV